jgi:hypothetical protein
VTKTSACCRAYTPSSRWPSDTELEMWVTVANLQPADLELTVAPLQRTRRKPRRKEVQPVLKSAEIRQGHRVW